jgi:extracellular elastinolytic metalloproteinase
MKFKTAPRFFLPLFLLLLGNAAYGQSKEQAARNYLLVHASELGVTTDDQNDLKLISENESRTTGISNLYFVQRYQGIEINNAIFNIHLAADERVITYGNRLEASLKKRTNATKAALTPEMALEAAAVALGYPFRSVPRVKEKIGGAAREVIFEKGALSEEDIPVKLVYQPMEDGVIYLTWEVYIHEPTGHNAWLARVDAQTGKLLARDNLVTHCNFGDGPGVSFFRVKNEEAVALPLASEWFSPPASGGSYRVFPPPLESPNDGGRQLVHNPADPTASPLGWHNTGANQYTVTRGNNTHAYTDIDANNQPDPGSDPNGGSGLVFDFPLDLNAAPSTYRPAAVTNLFFWNNYIHDFAYTYGFDELSGNFQVNNFGNGGAGNDDVRAEAQDGSGTNNANFFTPVDGQRPRMQMFVWNQGPSSVAVNSPGPAVVYEAGNAGFGPLNFNVSGDLQLASPIEACTPLVGFTAGKIALIDRGNCNFVNKVIAAQNAGAIAAIICNNVGGAPPSMGGAGNVTIPSLSLSQANCNTIKAVMASQTVNVTLDRVLVQYDSDFDNGVIAHEYAHGISNRYTGGRTVANCLNNSEQMGEGWSDWYGLMTSIDPNDQGADIRGIGTYVSGQSPMGNGIRPTPYSTDMSINPATYGILPTMAIPHGVGYVWCGMIWDLSWALMDRYGKTIGFDRAMWLVNEGMRMQPCRPGFVDGRNAILAADQALYGGANHCLIWQVFARRGLGFSASQGSNQSAADGVEAFDLPPYMTADSDCDGVPDYCDACPGGNDSYDTDGDGIPNCSDWDGFANAPSAWKGGPNNSQIMLCHVTGNNRQTILVNPNSVQGHLSHGDFIGPCSSCNQGMQSSEENYFVNENYISVFPNPATGSINVSLRPFEGRAGALVIHNAQGQIVYQQRMQEMGGVTTIDVSRFSPGIYQCMAFSDDKEMQTVKFVVTR